MRTHEEELFGAEYAARRALGRAVAAGVAEGAERSLDARYEHPFEPDRHPQLSAGVRAELSEALARHREAREAERASTASYHSPWRSRVEELRLTLAPGGRTEIRPLLSRAEAEQTYARMGQAERTQVGRSMRGMEVMTEKSPDRLNEAPRQSFAEWAAKSLGGSAQLRHEYAQGLGDANIRSHGQAQREIARDQPTRGKGR